MLSALDLAHINLNEARQLRAAGMSYRSIARRLRLSPSQLSHIRRALKREKAARTRLRKSNPAADDRALPIGQSALPADLRRRLIGAGFATLGDVAERIVDPDLSGLETISGIGAHRVRRIKALLDQFGMLPDGPDDLRAQIEQLFPELSDEQPVGMSSVAPARSSRPHSR